MKIIFLGGNFNLSGGTERVASIIANELTKIGYEITVVSAQGGGHPFYPLDSRIKIRSLFSEVGRNLLRTPLLIYRIRKLVLEEKADVLVTVESMLALFTVPATVGLETRNICWEHFNFNNDLGRRGRRIDRHLAARYCDVVVTLTERDRSYWKDRTTGSAKIVAIPNPSPFPVQFIDHDVSKKKIVLATGRLASQKGFDMLLQTWSLVAPSSEGWRLRIVGDGPERESLAGQARSLGISETVEFTGLVSDVEKHYREASIFCLSSRYEGFGMVLLEAMAFGLPVVSFDCDMGPAEVLEGTGGKLVAQGNVEELTKELLGLMDSPEERLEISALSQKKAQLYQPDNILGEWVKAIN
jgi:glycosyltransferase involved in cell wall biosynthesis